MGVLHVLFSVDVYILLRVFVKHFWFFRFPQMCFLPVFLGCFTETFFTEFMDFFHILLRCFLQYFTDRFWFFTGFNYFFNIVWLTYDMSFHEELLKCFFSFFHYRRLFFYFSCFLFFIASFNLFHKKCAIWISKSLLADTESISKFFVCTFNQAHSKKSSNDWVKKVFWPRCILFKIYAPELSPILTRLC